MTAFFLCIGLYQNSPKTALNCLPEPHPPERATRFFTRTGKPEENSPIRTLTKFTNSPIQKQTYKPNPEF
jgi:hypothetical protein